MNTTQSLKRLVKAGAVGIKADMEAGGQTVMDVLGMACRIGGAALPVYVKIGGCEDRNALKSLFRYGINHFVAPMVETPFALTKFVEAAQWVSGENISALTLGINIETKIATQKFSEMAASDSFRYIARVTVGRSDLAASMGTHPDSDQVMEETRIVFEKARRAGKLTTLGGSITTSNIVRALSLAGMPDFVETRHVIFQTRKMVSPPDSIAAALGFEKLLTELDMAQNTIVQNDLLARNAELSKRLESFEPGGLSLVPKSSKASTRRTSSRKVA